MSDSLTQAEWLLGVANSPDEAARTIAYYELVQRGLARIEDLAELCASGMKVFEIAERPLFKVWIDAREFVAASIAVAKLRDDSDRGWVN